MEITVKLLGPLRKLVEGHQAGVLNLSLPEGTTISQAVEALGLSDQVRMLMLNGHAQLEDRALDHGDRLTLLPPQMAFNMYVATGFLSPMAREKIRRQQQEKKD